MRLSQKCCEQAEKYATQHILADLGALNEPVLNTTSASGFAHHAKRLMLRLSLIDTLVAVCNGSYGLATVSKQSPLKEPVNISTLTPWLKPLQKWPKSVAEVIDLRKLQRPVSSAPRITHEYDLSTLILSTQGSVPDGDQIICDEMLRTFQDEGICQIKRRILSVALAIRLMANVSLFACTFGSLRTHH